MSPAEGSRDSYVALFGSIALLTIAFGALMAFPHAVEFTAAANFQSVYYVGAALGVTAGWIMPGLVGEIKDNAREVRE